jgi:hypothetical protein
MHVAILCLLCFDHIAYSKNREAQEGGRHKHNSACSTRLGFETTLVARCGGNLQRILEPFQGLLMAFQRAGNTRVKRSRAKLSIRPRSRCVAKQATRW